MVSEKRNMKKLTSIVIFGVVMSMLGCTFTISTPATPTQVEEVITGVATTVEASTQTPSEADSTQSSTEVATQAGGTPVSFEGVSFVIPNGLASSANTEKMTAVESNSGAPWDIAPTHWRFTFIEYPLQGKFHEPRVFVYPADEYAQNNPSAAEQIERLKKILSGGAPMQETLPTVPFFNAAAQIAANIKIFPFQNGGGVRSLTQYAQYAAPINNHELFYQFQGLTNDGKYYVIAILPITAPILPEDEKPEATVPEGGVPIPADIGPNDVYYFSVTEKLNTLPPDSYTPSLNTLDALIQSFNLAP
jgi:hypothetical protein